MSATKAIQIVRAKTASPRSNAHKPKAVMKYGVGFVADSFCIARTIRRKGKEAANAGMFRRACGESGKKCRAAKSDTEKNKAPEPAATTRKPRRSIFEVPTEIQRRAEKKVRTTAAAIPRSEWRKSATPITTKSRTSRQSQTADDVSSLATQIQIRRSGISGR